MFSLVSCVQFIIFTYLNIATVLAKMLQTTILKSCYIFNKAFLGKEWFKEDIFTKEFATYENFKPINRNGFISSTPNFSDQVTQTDNINNQQNLTKEKLGVDVRICNFHTSKTRMAHTDCNYFKIERNPCPVCMYSSQYLNAKLENLSVKAECSDSVKYQSELSECDNMSIKQDVSKENTYKKDSFRRIQQKHEIVEGQKTDSSSNCLQTEVESNFLQTLKSTENMNEQVNLDTQKTFVKQLSGENFNCSVNPKQTIDKIVNDFKAGLRTMQTNFEKNKPVINKPMFSAFERYNSAKSTINGKISGVDKFANMLKSQTQIEELGISEIQPSCFPEIEQFDEDYKGISSCSSYESLPVIDRKKAFNKFSALPCKENASSTLDFSRINTFEKAFNEVEDFLSASKSTRNDIPATVSHSSSDLFRTNTCDIIKINTENKLLSDENDKILLKEDKECKSTIAENSSALQTCESTMLENIQTKELIVESIVPETEVISDSSDTSEESGISMDYQNPDDSKASIIIETYTLPLPPGKELLTDQPNTTIWYLIGGQKYSKEKKIKVEGMNYEDLKHLKEPNFHEFSRNTYLVSDESIKKIVMRKIENGKDTFEN